MKISSPGADGDISQYPILSKETLRKTPVEDLLVPGVDLASAERFVTSGSTGRRVEGYHDRASHDYHTGALVRRFLATRHYWPFYRLTHIKPYPAPRKLYEYLGLFRRHVVASHLPMDQIIRATLANRPHILLGIPTYLREFIRTCSSDDLMQLRKTLKAVFTESEMLPPCQRAYIEEALGVPVFDEYSAFEALNIYYECSEGGKHIAEDRVLVEIVDDSGRVVEDGSEGHIVVTPYMESAMPLLRYRIGDVGLINESPCSCGRTFKTMEITKGRTSDAIQINGKRMLYWADIILIAMGLGNALDCHLHQKSDGSVDFFFVPRIDDEGAISETKKEIRIELYRKAGQSFSLDIHAVEQIPKTTGGKGRLVVSDLGREVTA